MVATFSTNGPSYSWRICTDYSPTAHGAGPLRYYIDVLEQLLLGANPPNPPEDLMEAPSKRIC